MKANWNWGNINPNAEIFSAILDNIANKDFDKMKDVFENLGKNFKDWGKEFEKSTQPHENKEHSTNVKMNVVEGAGFFRLEVAAPGLKKEDFKVSIQGKNLTIQVQKDFTILQKDETYKQKEFDYSNFKCHFAIPDTANSEKIEASYTNGILILHIAKKEEAIDKPAREIVID